MKFVVGSASPRKIATAQGVIKHLLNDADVTVAGYSAKSNVPPTPWDKETFQGAINRAKDALDHSEDTQYAIGLESGLVERYGHVYEEAWCCVLAANSDTYMGYSSGLMVPKYVIREMTQANKAHAEVMGMLEQRHNLNNGDSDTWGSYSDRMILREVSLEEALRNALIQVFASEKSLYKLGSI